MSDPGKLLLEAVEALHQEQGAIPEGAMTIYDVMEKLDLSYDAARKYLKQLIESGKASRVRRGKNLHYYFLKE